MTTFHLRYFYMTLDIQVYKWLKDLLKRNHKEVILKQFFGIHILLIKDESQVDTETWKAVFLNIQSKYVPL